MRQTGLRVIIALVAAVLLTGCDGGGSDQEREQAALQMAKTQQQRNYDGLLLLADSFETQGFLAPAEANYWRGYASDRLGQYRMAEFFWKASLKAAGDDDNELDVVARSASRLANLLSIRGDYTGVLKMGLPVAEQLEAKQYTETSDYVNLLIYIGLCQAATNQTGKANEDGFERAYQKHIKNVEKNRNDAAFKDAIAGLTNIAYYCLTAEKYKEALNWTERYGKLLEQYEQLPGVNATYVDKQVARYDIYQAQALEGLRRHEDAARAFEAFQATRYSLTPEGRIMANDYLEAAKRWDEAADNYQSLDAIMKNEETTIASIQDQMLKKYRTNLQAGRTDSAAAVSMQICDVLNDALNHARQLDTEEQATIVTTVERIGDYQRTETRRWQLILMGVVAIVVLCLVVWFIYRHFIHRNLQQAHGELKTAYDQLEKHTTEKERTETERRIAAGIRQSVLPAEMLGEQRIGLFATLQPGKMAGGDFYDYLTRDGLFYFCIGTVPGKDIQTATQMTMTVAQFRAAAAIETVPGHIVTAINRSMDQERTMPVRLFVGVIDLATGRLQFSNAGHTVPLLTGNDTLNQVIVDENPSVGTSPDSTYSTQELTMQPGAMVFVFTQGLMTAHNAEGQPYGERRMLGAALQAMKVSTTPEEYVDSMAGAVGRYTEGSPQSDDLTMMAVQFRA